MERLKGIIETFAENESHIQCLKEIEDIPLSVFLSQNLYRLNGDIRRLSEARINDISSKFSKARFERPLVDPASNNSFRPSFNGIRWSRGGLRKHR